MPESPKVLIVGAGMGGLTLGLLLERIGVDFEIFERASCAKPLGAAMSIGPNILPLFEQLGMLDDIMKMSLPGRTMDVYNEDMTLVGRTDNTAFMEERSGFPPIMFSRPELHRLLLSKIPAFRVHFNKRVLSVGQSDKGVLLRCTDGCTHEGDILIGADGAYSAVRQSLYERLQKEELLPKSDTLSLNVGYSCMVGTTRPLSPEKFPMLKDDYAHFAVVVAEGKPHSVSVQAERFCFGIVIQLHGAEKDETFRNSEWGPESLDSKNDRSACHKMLPSAGQGAINAMQDAVIVANCIYDLESVSHKKIVAALNDYKSQRYAHAKKQVQISSMVGKILYGQTWFEKFMRKAVFNWIPRSFEERSFIKSAAYRPQVNFLPFAENRTNLKVLPQKLSSRQTEQRQVQLKQQRQQQQKQEEEGEEKRAEK
ncbi:hypothetical protein BGX27_007809 [Mortierella sp. AM989]|nr:hypothetical protein BGX27_007809 [Mortierella sp. AM989]